MEKGSGWGLFLSSQASGNWLAHVCYNRPWRWRGRQGQGLMPSCWRFLGQVAPTSRDDLCYRATLPGVPSFWGQPVKVKVKLLSRVRLFATPWTVTCIRLLRPQDFLGKSTGVGCHFLLSGLFPTQGSNPGLPHCRQTLYCLSHQGNLNLLNKYILKLSFF